MKSKKIIIIGSGIAGLAAAIRLRSYNYDVAVYESNTYPGGKLTEMRSGGYRFDCGPSLFTMPQYVEELFEVSGKRVSDYFVYKKKERVCNYFYEDGTRFTALADRNNFAKEAEKVFDVKEGALVTYFNKSKEKFDLTSSLFLEKSLHKLTTYLSTDTIKAITRIGSLDIHKSLHVLNKSSFRDQRLIQFFDRFATYNGSSPYVTPGIMSMIPHLEQYYGTFFPKGGMCSITKSLFQLAKDVGVVFHLGARVDEIVVREKKAKGVLVNADFVTADIVVSNMDVVPTYKKLLPAERSPEKIVKQPRSSSALIFYWGIKKEFSALDLHNIFFAKKYKEEFAAIFDHQTVSDDPTVYINVTSKEELADAPNGCENWFVMINVPSNTGQDWDAVIERSRANILQKISHILQEDVESLIEVEEILDPRSIEHNTQSYQGSLYGSSSNSKYAAFLRHPNFSKNIEGLYFCGGSVHPGGGIPLCLLSAKIVSELIKKDSSV